MSDVNDPGWGGCFGFLFGLAAITYFSVFWVPFFAARDEVMSACPKSGISRVDDVLRWDGVTYHVTCLDGTKVDLNWKGEPTS